MQWFGETGNIYRDPLPFPHFCISPYCIRKPSSLLDYISEFLMSFPFLRFHPFLPDLPGLYPLVWKFIGIISVYQFLGSRGIRFCCFKLYLCIHHEVITFSFDIEVIVVIVILRNLYSLSIDKYKSERSGV